MVVAVAAVVKAAAEEEPVVAEALVAEVRVVRQLPVPQAHPDAERRP